ncbi:Pyrrolidone-carboxylate peptidase [Caulifigura coniformis]|uniref:Pyrrolidone-carboxylate peptidase n=1 Tax=Caulifigura coniformis TaxID=2527983 RepID=A0A517SM14_9PLAN|nr:pyroglutamyl-peptidase I [Caulifigura coniformis]QDT57164.1 Pyrrolidone-carboxylate peptidase [Caulifigura coniformis]
MTTSSEAAGTPAVRTVLVTGFEPFGGETENPSRQIALELAGRSVLGRTIVSEVLPCVFGKSTRALRTAIRKHAPELVICLGQAGGRAGLTLERVAINLDDAPLPDNAGVRPIDQPILKSGPAAYWSTLPVKGMARAMAMAGIEASVSHSAGTYVCNHVFYGLMQSLKRRPATRGGFIHVPFLPEQSLRQGRSAPFMLLPQMVRGIEVAIETALSLAEDASIAGGATH